MLGTPGTYEDPLTGGPRAGPALAYHLVSIWERFPEAHYDIVRVTGDAQSVTVEWTATGLGNATKAEPLPGVFIIDVQADRIAMVRGYFDPSGLRR